MDIMKDELAFGFMTYYPNGTLVRIDSGFSADYFEAEMVSSSVKNNSPCMLILLESGWCFDFWGTWNQPLRKYQSLQWQ